MRPNYLSRSQNMARIRGRDTRVELRLRRALWGIGRRYRLRSDLPGHPDLIFPRAKLAVFLDGCFWHGCPSHYSTPNVRRDFWAAKLKANVRRDLEVSGHLARMGWHIIRLWQHELDDMPSALRRILVLLESSDPQMNLLAPDKPILPTEALVHSAFSSTRQDLPCSCEQPDVCVIEIRGTGSLRPKAKRKPEAMKLICRSCRAEWWQILKR